jgi:hypothetical protein
LVERQLCKLDVRGSNPLASIFPAVIIALMRDQRVSAEIRKSTLRLPHSKSKIPSAHRVHKTGL